MALQLGLLLAAVQQAAIASEVDMPSGGAASAVGNVDAGVDSPTSNPIDSGTAMDVTVVSLCVCV